MDWITAEEQVEKEYQSDALASNRLYVMEQKQGKWYVFAGKMDVGNGAFLLDPKSRSLNAREALKVQRFISSHRGASERLRRALNGGYGRLSREIEDNSREELMLIVEDLRGLGVKVEGVFGEGI